jgi:hypothetical protein
MNDYNGMDTINNGVCKGAQAGRKSQSWQATFYGIMALSGLFIMSYYDKI